MSERIPAPTEIASTNWNSNGTTYPSTDPGGAKRATGFKPDNVPPASGDGEIVTANDQNWLHGLAMQMHTWAKQFVPREWEELSEGIANASVVRQLLRVVPPSSGIRSRLATMYTQTSVATGTGSPKSIATTGLEVFYIAGTANRYIVSVSPVDGQDGAGGGVPLWEINPHGAADVTALTTDGMYVYYILSATVTGLQRVDTLTGGNLTAAGAKVNHNKLRANGFHVVGITGAGVVDSWTASTMADNWTANPTSGLGGVATDEESTYVGGTRNTNDVWAYTNTAGGAVWSVTLDANAPTVRDIAADGDFVYVATDSFAIAAGGNRDIFCLERVSGAVLWSMDLGVNITQITVDDEYIYALDSAADQLYMIRKGQNGAAPGDGPAVVKIKTNVGAAFNDTLSCDGTGLYAVDGTTATDLIRISNGGVTKTYMRVSGQDSRRRPFQTTLAVPTTGRT